jgi:structural maintenance of chromosomes protein 5
VRIKVKNFVTYSSAEFRCGPSLNMVLGPNGTGKSSLVCAICLGLGWSPAQLGRAKDIGEFVKNGFKEAEIEIELKAGTRQRGRNPVVKRVIKREGNKSTWYINGAATSHKEVQSLMKYFGIQVDNLCQFLPQDKVADFAAMSPVELLEQTQKAVGTAEMSEWHESLRRLGSERRKHINDKGQIDGTLSELQTRQNQQKAEVERLQERTALQFRLNALEKHRVSLNYQKEKDRYDAARNRKQEAKDELAQLQSEVEPLLQDANSKEDYRHQLQRVLEQRKQMVERAKRNVDTVLGKIEGHRGKIDECNRQINTTKESKSKRNSDLIKKRNMIAQLEGRLKNEPPTFDTRDHNERRRAKDNERRQVKARITETEESISPKFNELKSLKAQATQVQSEISQLDTRSGQQTQKLRQISTDSHKAWSIIKDMKDKFEHEIFGPPIVSCSLKNPEVAAAVETVLQRTDVMAFTVQSEKDSRTLQNLLYKQHKLADISIRTILTKVSQFKAPVEDVALKNYGFDGWLLDAVEGPEPVLAMLCDSSRLHKVAYSAKGDQFDFERVKQSPLDSFIVKDQFYSINRRPEYGPDAVSTQLRQAKPKGFWTDAGSNISGETELRQQLRAIQEKMAALKADIEQFRSEKKSLEEKVQEFSTQIVGLPILLIHCIDMGLG